MNRRGMIFTGMGFELVGLMIGSLYLGDMIDKALGWSGLGVAGLTFLVLLGWLYHLIILLKRFSSDNGSGPTRS